jgi:hypothetical protein
VSLFEAAEFDGHEEVAFLADQPTRLRAILAVHDTTLGPALGGCRMLPYASSTQALQDALRPPLTPPHSDPWTRPKTARRWLPGDTSPDRAPSRRHDGATLRHPGR